MVRLAKKMKKNNVAVDIVNFGEEAENTAKLDAFISNVNNGDNRFERARRMCVFVRLTICIVSHLVTIPPGPHILSDMLISSPIISGEEGAPSGFGSGGDGFDFGVDPNLDPELALALRISLEEEKARQEAEAAKQGGGDDKKGESSQASGGESMVIDKEPAAKQEDDDAELQAALAMSMDNAQSGVPVSFVVCLSQHGLN